MTPEARTLLVVDSPRKAKTLAQWLGKDFQVIGCAGPVRTLLRAIRGIDVKHGFTVEYEVPPARQKEVRALAAAAQGTSSVFLAAPPGGGGEAFCARVAETLRKTREAVQRIELTEITEAGLVAALRRPRAIDENAVGAAEARDILDRLARGALDRCCGEEPARAGSLGRLEALALAMLCTLVRASEPRAVRSLARNARPVGRGDLQSAAEGRPSLEASFLEVPRIERRDIAPAAPQPFTIVTLLGAAFSALGLSARQTLRLADRLHEGVELPGGRVGLITSPWSGGRPGGAAPICPTSAGPEPSSIEKQLSRAEGSLYRLVWDQFVASQQGGATVEVGACLSVEGPWSEADLVRELVERRVGPAIACVTTAAALQEAGLVEGGPAALRPTRGGRRAGALLQECFPDLAGVTAVAALEGQVEALGRGEQTRLGLFGPFWKEIEQGLRRAARRRDEPGEDESRGPACDRCGAAMVERDGPYGRFRACSTYPACTNTQALDGVPRAREVGLLCPRCSKAPIVERLGPTGRLFYGCRAYPKCRFTTHHRPVGEPCPRCGAAFLLEKETRRDGRVLACEGCPYQVRASMAPFPSPARPRANR